MRDDAVLGRALPLDRGLGPPPWVGESEYWLRLRPPLWKNCITVGPVTRTAGRPAYSWLKALTVNVASHPADVGRMLA